jgi:dTDP-4-amino-4,6-dideoxy-D-glucose/dTDP-4-amino-2,4-dideoxy-beta-L-xylose transaminase
LSPRTRAIMVVHWAGYPCDLSALRCVQMKCQEEFGFTPPIIEDCAHAWGSADHGKPLGNHGNLCVYSFQAIKTFTTCDGGLLVLPDEELDRRARLLRWYGLDRTSTKDFRCAQDIEEWGYKFHMNDVNATIGIYNYPHIAGLVRKQQENAAYFNDALKDIEGLTLVGGGTSSRRATSAYWLYTIRVERRSDFERKMNDAGIMVSRVHARNDKHSTVQEFCTHLPGLDLIDAEMICIPCGWWLTPEDREYIVRTIQSGW